jgi:hypothetical protein
MAMKLDLHYKRKTWETGFLRKIEEEDTWEAVTDGWRKVCNETLRSYYFYHILLSR